MCRSTQHTHRVPVDSFFIEWIIDVRSLLVSFLSPRTCLVCGVVAASP